MSQLKVDTITNEAGTGSPSLPNGLTVGGVNYPTSGPLSNRNKIINGAMVIDQRNAGASYNPPPNQGYSLDRWTTWLSQNTFSVQQNAGAVTPPAGFSNYLGVTVTSATTISVSDYFGVGHKIEGYNIADLNWGTASAQAITLSFWVRSSLTGNFGAVIRRGDGGQYYAFLYAISSANTWEYKTVTIAGPTTGSWNATNGTGLFLLFGFGAGSNQTASSNDIWVDGGVLGASGATPVVGTNGATFYITGVQLEAGTVATPFEHRSFGQELALCQRYYQEYWSSLHSYNLGPVGYVFGSLNSAMGHSLPVAMRATPSVQVRGLLDVRGGRIDGVNVENRVSAISNIGFGGNGLNLTYICAATDATLVLATMTCMGNGADGKSNAIVYSAEI
jgi:hypothetical protein